LTFLRFFILIKHFFFSLGSIVVVCIYLQIQNVKPQAITRKKDTKHAVALDSENNNVCVKDIVKVVDGPHSVRGSDYFTLFRA